MNQKNFPLVGSAVLLVLWFLNSQHAPDIDPRRPDGPDLYPAFSQSGDKPQAHCDAELFGSITGSVAAMLDYDGKLSDPRVDTGLQVDDLRRWARDYATQGASFKAKYPLLADEVKKYLDQHAGTSGGPLDDAKRAAWIKALREISANSHWAAGRLD